MLLYSASSRQLVTWPDYKRPRLNGMLFNCLWSRGIESSVRGCMEASSTVRNMLILCSWVASTTLRAHSVPIWNTTRPALPFLLTNRLYISWLPWQRFGWWRIYSYDYDNDNSECTSGTHELEARFDSDNFEVIQNVCAYPWPRNVLSLFFVVHVSIMNNWVFEEFLLTLSWVGKDKPKSRVTCLGK